MIGTIYVRKNRNAGCCLKNNDPSDTSQVIDGRFHERCEYNLPTVYCKKFCSQDPNCKGFVYSSKRGHCEIATTAACDKDSSGTKYDIGNTEGELSGYCGQNYGGCYIKQSEGMKPYYY